MAFGRIEETVNTPSKIAEWLEEERIASEKCKKDLLVNVVDQLAGTEGGLALMNDILANIESIEEFLDS